MVRPKKRRKSTPRTSAGRKRSQPTAKQKPLSLPDTTLDTIREKRFEIVVLTVFLTFGVYKSITLWGAYPIPNPDFPGFVGVGRSLLSFEVPPDFKRAPAVGIFQALLMYLLGPDSELTAEERAKIKAIDDREYWDAFEYDYDDDPGNIDRW